MTRAEAARGAAERLRAGQVDTPDLDARILSLAAFGLTLSEFVAGGSAAVTGDETARLKNWLARRIAGEPVDRILGEREFWGMVFRLAPDTLSPRPDSETIVETALALTGAADRPLRILDLGTGSGCLLLAALKERPHAFGVGLDRSPGAAAAARDNAERLGLGERAAFAVGSWGEALGGGAFDLVLSNPPYIPSREVNGLEPEVRDHDPRFALDGGADGLVAYRAILADLDRLLAPDGLAVLELGAGQAEDVSEIAAVAGFRVIRAAEDLGGVTRALALRRAFGA